MPLLVIFLSECKRKKFCRYASWITVPAAVLTALISCSNFIAMFSPINPFLETSVLALALWYLLVLFFARLILKFFAENSNIGTRWETIYTLRGVVIVGLAVNVINFIVLVYALWFTGDYTNQFEKKFPEAVQRFYSDIQNNESHNAIQSINILQMDYDCCGFRRGFLDYLLNINLSHILDDVQLYSDRYSRSKKLFCGAYKFSPVLDDGADEEIAESERKSLTPVKLCYIPYSCCRSNVSHCSPYSILNVADEKHSVSQDYLDRLKEAFKYYKTNGCFTAVRSYTIVTYLQVLIPIAFVLMWVSWVLMRLVQTSVENSYEMQTIDQISPAWIIPIGGQSASKLFDKARLLQQKAQQQAKNKHLTELPVDNNKQSEAKATVLDMPVTAKQSPRELKEAFTKRRLVAFRMFWATKLDEEADKLDTLPDDFKNSLTMSVTGPTE